MGDNRPRGHTGQKVLEAGTYRSQAGATRSYVPGEEFAACPVTGKPTVWEKAGEPDHPGR